MCIRDSLDAVSLKTLYLWMFRTVERSGLNRVEGRIVCAGPLRRLRVQCPRYPVRQRLNGGRTQIIGRHALRGAEAREIPVLRAVIKWVVVVFEQFTDEFAPVPLAHQRMPALKCFAAVQVAQHVEARIESVGRVQEVVVLAQQEFNARRETGFNVDAGADTQSFE